MEFQLSENLYIIDEVCITFIQCIISHTELKQILFWFFELYYSLSHENLINGIKSIYLQFYCKNYPRFSKYINKKIMRFESDNNPYHLFNIIYNLYKFTPSSDAFLINYHVTYSTDISALYITHSRKYYNKNPMIKQLILAIKFNDYQSIAYYLKRIDFDTIIGLFNDRYLPEGFDKNIELLCAFIVSNLENEQYSFKCYTCPINIFTDMKIHFEKKPIIPYKKLTYRRLYSIHDTLLYHDYMRSKTNDLKSIMYYHWKYYVKDSRIWKQKYKEANVTFNDINKTIAFDNDIVLESFYENDNCMDFDEQSKKVQDMSMLQYKTINNPEKWFIYLTSG